MNSSAPARRAPAGREGSPYRREDLAPRKPRLVKIDSRVQSRRRLVFLGLSLTVVSAALFGLLALTVLENQQAFHIAGLRKAAAERQARYEELMVEVDRLESPGRIQSEAQGRLGMVGAGPAAFLVAPPKGSARGAVSSPTAPERTSLSSPFPDKGALTAP
ncbi:MAG: hypothetical protein WDA71_05415 [Actinomycetota bacterium]